MTIHSAYDMIGLNKLVNMRKIIRLYPAIPQLMFVLSPFFVISLIYPVFLPAAVALLGISLMFYLVADDTTEKSWPIILFEDLVTFLVLLFFAELFCINQTEKRENLEYYVPGFLVDFFSPNQIALKLVSVALVFVITLMLRRKAKELF